MLRFCNVIVSLNAGLVDFYITLTYSTVDGRGKISEPPATGTSKGQLISE